MDDFLQQIETYKNEFYRYIYRSVWDSSLADDVFSEAVLAAYKSKANFSAGSNFRAWMYRIITNKCFIANREVSRRYENIDDYKDSFIALADKSDYTKMIDDPEEFLTECSDEVLIAFAKLSTAQKSCLMLKIVEHFSYKEIAEILEIPLGTVVTHLARGRAKLRIELLEYAKNEGIFPAKIQTITLTKNVEYQEKKEVS